MESIEKKSNKNLKVVSKREGVLTFLCKKSGIKAVRIKLKENQNSSRVLLMSEYSKIYNNQITHFLRIYFIEFFRE